MTPVNSIATFSLDADTQADMFQRINEQKATSRKTGQIYVRAIQHLKEVQRVLECLIYENAPNNKQNNYTKVKHTTRR